MSGARMRIWMDEAARGVVDESVAKVIKQRFMLAAARDMGGERAYVPCRASQDSAHMRTALRLHQLGMSFDECQDALQVPLSKSTFYRRKRAGDGVSDSQLFEAQREGINAGLKADHWACEFVYAFGFTGDDEYDDWIKIGYSQSPRDRIKAFLPHTDLAISEVAIVGIPGPAMVIEKAAHEVFADFRRAGTEWFNRIPGGVDAVASIIDEKCREKFGSPLYLRRL